MLMPAALTDTNRALAFVIVWYETHAEMSCLLTTSADPKPESILPINAIFIESYAIAKEYIKFPTNGHTAEKMSADLNDDFVYQIE